MKVKKYSWQEVKEGVFLRKECTPIAPSGDLQKAGNELIMKIARANNIPILLTLDAHFVNEEQKFVQDLLLQNGKADDAGMKFHTRYYQMDTQTAWEKWLKIHGEEYSSHFSEAVENNHSLAAMCERITMNKEYHLPEVSFPQEIIEASDSFDYKCKLLAIELVNKGNRLKDDPRYVERLKKELKVIADNGKINLLPYFFALHDICQNCKRLGIWVGAGRGSAGGCLLAYLLNITHIDPIEYGLSFERFLSIGRINRGKLPDIDIDFSEPDRIAELMKSKFSDKFARICTTGTTKVKSAIRDVARVILDTKNNEVMKARVDSVCKTISNIPQGFNDLLKWLHGWQDEEGYHQGELESNEALKTFFEDFPTVQNLVEQVIGIPKSLGRHASAYCLSDVPINEIVPVCRINEEDCTQFTMEAVESLGLVKFDLLGLNTLKDIGNAVKLIQSRHGVEIDIYNVPMEDAVFQEFTDGRTETVFQFNGPIPTEVCKRVGPNSIIDLASITAACRPGTMYATMEDEDTGEKTTLIALWVDRREGKKDIKLLHEGLKDILSSTHGIVLFQEQISAMFEKSCNYSAEQADEIREIIGKKKADKMNEILPNIRKRLTDNGWNASQINSFVSLCKSSSNYAFNLSHSVSYSYMAYICMWLKSHYPIEWWTAILQNSNHDDLEKNAKFFKNKVKHPEINISEIDFYIIDKSDELIVYPLTMIKGVKNASGEIFQKRPYTSFQDFFQRVDKTIVNKRVVNALIWSGSLDSMPEAGDGDITSKRNTLAKVYAKYRRQPEPSDVARGKIEMLESNSLCIGRPDIINYFQGKGRKDCIDFAKVLESHADTPVCTAGVITAVKRITTKKGDEMCFIDLSNKELVISVTCFPKQYEAYKSKIEAEAILFLNGRINVFNDRKSIIADNLTFYNIEDIN